MGNLTLKSIRLFAMDVDGILTDGRIIYDSQGQETKAFNIKDGLGLKLLQRAQIKTAIITGRSSPMVERRAEELGINWVIQGREDKLAALIELAQQAGLSLEEIAYMGDDLPDLAAIQSVGLGLTVADAHEQILHSAHHVTHLGGGAGAVREAAEWLLQQQGKLNGLLAGFQRQP